MLGLNLKDYEILSVLKMNKYMSTNQITCEVGFNCLDRVSLMHEEQYVHSKPMQPFAFSKSTATYNKENYQPIDFENIAITRIGQIALENHNETMLKEKKSLIRGLVYGFILGILASIIATLVLSI